MLTYPYPPANDETLVGLMANLRTLPYGTEYSALAMVIADRFDELGFSDRATIIRLANDPEFLRSPMKQAKRKQLEDREAVWGPSVHWRLSREGGHFLHGFIQSLSVYCGFWERNGPWIVATNHVRRVRIDDIMSYRTPVVVGWIRNAIHADSGRGWKGHIEYSSEELSEELTFTSHRRKLVEKAALQWAEWRLDQDRKGS